VALDPADEAGLIEHSDDIEARGTSFSVVRSASSAGETGGVLAAVELVTERFVLAPLVVADATEMVDVLGDEAMHTFTGGRPRTFDELREHYTWLAAGRSADGTELWFNWIVRPADGGGPVGVLQATVAPDLTTAEVAWEIGVPWQGRGIASEGARAVVAWLRDSGIESVRACVHPDHVASARVAEHAGLVRTAELDDGEVVWRLP
jgi:RimJ/RimL family protein N-acetyltransferase